MMKTEKMSYFPKNTYLETGSFFFITVLDMSKISNKMDFFALLVFAQNQIEQKSYKLVIRDKNVHFQKLL